MKTMMITAKFLGAAKEKFLSDAFGRGVFLVILGLTALSPTSVFADYVDANNEEYQSLDYIEATGNQSVLRSGESGTVTIDLTPRTRLVETSERISYSSAWSGAEGAAGDAVAVVEVNGEALISASGSGFIYWMPQGDGVYVLTHKVVSNGVLIGETLTATFERKTPADVMVDIGGGKSVTVPRTWIDEYPEIVAAAGDNLTVALNATAANGRLSVVECYVLGLDPENETNDFKIVSFPMGADGKPDVANIVFEPEESKWNVVGARAVLKGAETVDGDWHEVDKASEADRAKYRFYKVVVELP